MLTIEEKSKIRRHLGYMSVSSYTGLALGIPSSIPMLLILDNSMDRVMPEAELDIRRMVAELDCIEDQLSNSRTKLDVKSVSGGITTRGPEALDQLRFEYGHWARKLADALGTIVNPFSLAHMECGANTIVISSF